MVGLLSFPICSSFGVLGPAALVLRPLFSWSWVTTLPPPPYHRHRCRQPGEQPQTSPDTMSSASPGALHSMLGAMDKRVSEEVRSREGQWVGQLERAAELRLWSWTDPAPWAWPQAAVWLCPWPSSLSSLPGHEGLLHSLPVCSRRLRLPSRALPSGLQC